MLIDEAAGRAEAKSLGLRYTGTLGLLLRAKQASLVSEVRPLLHALQSDLRFFISDELRQTILRLAAE